MRIVEYFCHQCNINFDVEKIDSNMSRCPHCQNSNLEFIKYKQKKRKR